MAIIQDTGRGPIMEVDLNRTLTTQEIDTLDYAVAALGWRGWGYGGTGIAFKPTTVRLDP